METKLPVCEVLQFSTAKAQPEEGDRATPRESRGSSSRHPPDTYAWPRKPRKPAAPEYELPEVKGAIRYDSDIHTAEDVALMPEYVQERIAAARRRSPVGRLVITQTLAFPCDTNTDRRNLIEGIHGLKLVVENE